MTSNIHKSTVSEGFLSPSSGSAIARVLYFAPQTLIAGSNSGVQRVARQVADSLLAATATDLVKWDPIDGQLRYFNARDCDRFFMSGTWRRKYKINRFAERRRFRFDDTLPADERGRSWIMLPEISFHISNGQAIYDSVLAQAREYRLNTAAIFYDLIPVTNPHYGAERAAGFDAYLRMLRRIDLVMPISQHSADELTRHEHAAVNSEICGRRRRITAVSLGIASFAAPLSRAAEQPRADKLAVDRRDVILMVGTVEPRKQQVEVLRALKARSLGARFGLKIVIIGSLHPGSAAVFGAIIAGDEHIEYLGYCEEARMRAFYRRARFTIFASNDEGFGLPIAESLAAGVPCLTASFGAMREVGQGGGCLLVDVNDPDELGQSLERLASDDALVNRLKDEIAARPLREWKEYAADALCLMADVQNDRYAELSIVTTVVDAICAFRSASESSWSLTRFSNVDGESWTLACARDLVGPALVAFTIALRDAGTVRTVLFLSGVTFDLDGLNPSLLECFFKMDAWFFERPAPLERLIGLAGERAFAGMLPTCCAVETSTQSIEAAAAACLEVFVGAEAHRRSVAREEEAIQQVSTPLTMNPLLSIVISTYNRSSFVEENLRWLCSMLESYGGQITVTVVDNCSTDDTLERLAPFQAVKFVEIIRNTANVGMLGNLQVCAALLRAPYSWVIGDDDFILPDALRRVVDALRAHPTIPFVFVNFGVYYRTALKPGERAEALVVDPTLLTKTPSPSGVYPVRTIAGEHDNLFTAIYPIIFRTDILSACFDYPFTGRPFSSLIESIPTTKIILGSYAQCNAYWLSDVGIVGNSHNSWTRYRVQWHGVLMPQAFELGHEAGVDPHKLRLWSKVHENLYHDAKALFPDETLAANFHDDDLQTSFRVFRRRLELYATASSY